MLFKPVCFVCVCVCDNYMFLVTESGTHTHSNTIDLQRFYWKQRSSLFFRNAHWMILHRWVTRSKFFVSIVNIAVMARFSFKFFQLRWNKLLKSFWFCFAEYLNKNVTHARIKYVVCDETRIAFKSTQNRFKLERQFKRK